MNVLSIKAIDTFSQVMTVIIVFVVVLTVTYFVTKWVASYQKDKNRSKNFEIIETMRITSNKYLQIVKAGEKYLVIGIGKEEINILAELPREEVKICTEDAKPFLKFKEVLERTKKQIPKNR